MHLQAYTHSVNLINTFRNTYAWKQKIAKLAPHSLFNALALVFNGYRIITLLKNRHVLIYYPIHEIFQYKTDRYKFCEISCNLSPITFQKFQPFNLGMIWRVRYAVDEYGCHAGTPLTVSLDLQFLNSFSLVRLWMFAIKVREIPIA